MLEIRRYIAQNLKAPIAARRIYTAIKNAILSLKTSPARYPVIQDEPFKSQGFRLMPVENFVVFYVIDEEVSRVDALRVMYGKRDCQNLL